MGSDDEFGQQIKLFLVPVAKARGQREASGL